MSKEEFERADRQVMGMVNVSIPDNPNSKKEKPILKKHIVRHSPEERMAFCKLTVRVLTCLALAALFLLAILEPVFATAMGYLGVLASCIVGSIILDRHFRR